MTVSNGKHPEVISPAHIVSLMFKLLSSAKDSDDLSIGFDRDRGRRKDESASNKNIKRNYHVRIMLNVFGFAEHQEKSTSGLGSKITQTGNKDEAVLDNAVGTAVAKIKGDHIPWCVGHNIPSSQQKGILSKQNLSKTPTELRYIERSLFF